LLYEKTLGDPALIMRYINPVEAKFIDPASGIHIKFRLAGVCDCLYFFTALLGVRRLELYQDKVIPDMA